MDVIPDYVKSPIGLIPIDWNVQTIESLLLEISMGPFGSDIKVSNFVLEGVPVLSGVNVRSERLIDSFTNFVTPEKAKELKKAVASRGDIVITHRGTLGQISYIPFDSKFERYVISQSQFRARFNQNLVLPSWVALYFLSPSGSAKLLEGKGHTGVPALAQPTTKFRLLQIPVPPLTEQKNVTSTLADVDELLDSLDHLIAKKRNLKQAAMQQLLTGQTRLPGFSGEWAEKRLGDVICEISDGGTPPTSDSCNFGGDVPWVVIDDIKQRISSTRTTLTEKGLQACAARRWPQGTLIVSTGATIGEVGILEVSAATKQGICGIIFDPLLATPDFMQYWFFNYKKLLLSKAQGSSIKEVRAPTLVTLPLSLPEIDEQAAIATVLSDTDSELTELELRRNKVSTIKQGMMQELLTGRTRLV
jgi:type I restriction enzyme S subunit